MATHTSGDLAIEATGLAKSFGASESSWARGFSRSSQALLDSS